MQVLDRKRPFLGTPRTPGGGYFGKNWPFWNLIDLVSEWFGITWIVVAWIASSEQSRGGVLSPPTQRERQKTRLIFTTPKKHQEDSSKEASRIPFKNFISQDLGRISVRILASPCHGLSMVPWNRRLKI